MSSFYRIALLLCSLFLLYGTPLYSGEIPFYRWSLGAIAEVPLSISGDMRGDPEQFWDELYNNDNHSAYPLKSDAGMPGLGLGVQLSYRFRRIPFSVYIGGHLTSVSAYHGYDAENPGNFSDFHAQMSIISVSVGGEALLLGRYTDHWNTFGRLGVALNMIGAVVSYEYGNTVIPFEPRFGMDAELGERVTFNLFGPQSVEISVLYRNANLLGKSFTQPTTMAGRTLNDGRNPDDPNDSHRTIAFFSLRLGLRASFGN